MTEIGAYEAKTHFSQLLEQVAAGESVTITKHGKPVARLGPVDISHARPIAEVLEGIRSHRIALEPEDPDVREMIDEGRR